MANEDAPQSPPPTAAEVIAELEAKCRALDAHLGTSRGRKDVQAANRILQLKAQIAQLQANLSEDDTYVPPERKTRSRRPRQPSARSKSLPSVVSVEPQTKVVRTAKGKKLPSRFRIPVPVVIADPSRLPEKTGNRYKDADNTRVASLPPPVELKLPLANRQEALNAFRRICSYARPLMEAFSREFPGGESLCRDWIEAAATFPADTPLIDYVRKASPGRSVKELTEMKPSTLKKLANQIHETEFLNAISERLADRLKGENEATRANLFGNLKSYHTGLQSTKMKNPQVPFIAKKTLTRAETVAAVRGFMSVEMEPAEAEEYLSGLRKCTGRFAKKYAVGQKRKAWNGQRLVVGEFVRRRDASLLYDKETESLVLAVKSNKFGERLDVQRYIYADGTSLLSDLQLVSAKGAPKKCFIFPLLAKHDFLRYYTKNIRNHDPDADLEQRAFCSSVKVFLLEQSADGKPARVFLRPNFSFYRPNYPSISPQPEPVENQANYVIGIDRGVNSDLEAIVLDVRAKAIISRFGGSSRKEEWEIVRAQLAAATSRRDQIRNENPKGSNWSKRLDRANRALKLIRSKDRRLSQVSVVESVMSIVTTCEAQFGRGNYIIALENLGNMNVKRLNRVVSFAKVRAAFDQGLQRLGYSKADSQVPSPLRFVVARGTSQESIFTDWVANKENVASATAELNRPVGRYIGRDYLRFQDGVAKRKRKGDLGRTIGNQLFCNPFCEHYNGIEFPGGVIINADVQAAINIAVRVLFPKPMADCDAHERRKLVEFRSELRFEGWSPELFRFCGPAADPFAEIRSV